MRSCTSHCSKIGTLVLRKRTWPTVREHLAFTQDISSYVREYVIRRLVSPDKAVLSEDQFQPGPSGPRMYGCHTYLLQERGIKSSRSRSIRTEARKDACGLSVF